MSDIELVRPQGRDHWAALLAAQAASGLPASIWCKERGINVTSLYTWRKRLKDAPSGDTSSFIEVLDAPIPRLELVMGRVSIRLQSGFDRHLLCDVLDVLETR
jgi:hypothetical protein